MKKKLIENLNRARLPLAGSLVSRVSIALGGEPLLTGKDVDKLLINTGTDWLNNLKGDTCLVGQRSMPSGLATNLLINQIGYTPETAQKIIPLFETNSLRSSDIVEFPKARKKK